MQRTKERARVDDDLREEYRRRLGDRQAAHAQWARVEERVADARLIAFSVGLVMAFAILWSRALASLWLILPLAVFVGLVLVHEPLRRRSRRAGRAADFYIKGLGRMEDRWAGAGVAGLNFLNLQHSYAADLDLFGEGSLFERLCTARTRSGEETLAGWLLAPTGPPELAARHCAVVELRPRLDLREDLELLGSDVRSGIDPVSLAAWGKSPRVFPGRGPKAAAAVLALLGASSLIGWAFLDTGLLPFLAVLAVEGAFAVWLSRRVHQVLEAVDQRGHDLILLGALLDRLEREPFQAERLRELRQSLDTQGRPASVQIRRLARLLHMLDTKKNQIFTPFAAVLLWTTQFAMAIDAWRGTEGPAIANWLGAVGEFEALCALAAYAAENPEDPFPEIAPGEGEPRFEAERLGHPLISRAACVRNDVRLGGPARALVVSGSNMSGKSTLLRAVGVAAVMAQAGLPVRASRLRISPLAVGATLRIQDSLQAGKSRFYAEITRVRQMVDLAGESLPLLFLFDELFNGTNSHDRRIGAEAVLRGLIDRGSIGLITTHDLALTEIANNIGPQAVNVHFEDHFEDGQMRFDYTMRPGVVEHSNALALMRAVGLQV